MLPLSASDPTAPRHPIAVAAERTGLSQDVLRVWERRYGAVHPARGDGGQRLYSDADIERLTLLHDATRAGRAIGQIVALPVDALRTLVAEDVAARDRRPPSPQAEGARELIDTAVAHCRAMDGAMLNALLRRAAAEMGVPAFLETVAAPLLRRIGDEWHAGRLSPAHEHLASAVLHDLVTDTMRAFMPGEQAPRVLVTTPAGERHVIGAALVGAAAAVQGWNVLYLGADLPAHEIAGAAVGGRVRAVAVSAIYAADRERLLGELSALRARLPADVPLIAGGAASGRLEAELAPMGIVVETSLGGLVAALARVREAASGAAR